MRRVVPRRFESCGEETAGLVFCNKVVDGICCDCAELFNNKLNRLVVEVVAVVFVGTEDRRN
jgi:hypothetical protein